MVSDTWSPGPTVRWPKWGNSVKEHNARMLQVKTKNQRILMQEIVVIRKFSKSMNCFHTAFCQESSVLLVQLQPWMTSVNIPSSDSKFWSQDIKRLRRSKRHWNKKRQKGTLKYPTAKEHHPQKEPTIICYDAGDGSDLNMVQLFCHRDPGMSDNWVLNNVQDLLKCLQHWNTEAVNSYILS